MIDQFPYIYIYIYILIVKPISLYMNIILSVITKFRFKYGHIYNIYLHMLSCISYKMIGMIIYIN